MALALDDADSFIGEQRKRQLTQRQLLAQALMKTGGDTSPVYKPIQGVTRVLAGLVGGLNAAAEDRAAKERQAKQIADALQAFPGSPSTSPTTLATGATSATTGATPAAGKSAFDPKSVPSFVTAAGAPHGISPDYMARTAWIESKGDPNAKNPSGASGLFQFMPGTARQFGLTNPFDPAASADAAARLAAANRSTLQAKLGRDPTDAELYLAHQQGGAGAAGLLSNPNARAADIVGAKAVTANGGRPDMTAGEFARLWTGKYDALGGRQMAMPADAQGTSAPVQVASATPGDGSIAAALASDANRTYPAPAPGQPDTRPDWARPVGEQPGAWGQPAAAPVQTADVPLPPPRPASTSREALERAAATVNASPAPSPDWRTAQADPAAFHAQVASIGPQTASLGIVQNDAQPDFASFLGGGRGDNAGGDVSEDGGSSLGSLIGAALSSFGGGAQPAGPPAPLPVSNLDPSGPSGALLRPQPATPADMAQPTAPTMASAVPPDPALSPVAPGPSAPPAPAPNPTPMAAMAAQLLRPRPDLSAAPVPLPPPRPAFANQPAPNAQPVAGPVQQQLARLLTGGPDLSNSNDAGAGQFARSGVMGNTFGPVGPLAEASTSRVIAGDSNAPAPLVSPGRAAVAGALASGTQQPPASGGPTILQPNVAGGPAPGPNGPVAAPVDQRMAALRRIAVDPDGDPVMRKYAISQLDPNTQHVDLGDSVGLVQGNRLVGSIPKTKIPTFGVIGKDQYGNESYGFIDPSNMRVVGTGQPGGGQVLPGQPGSTIPAPPPGVDPKVWREAQSKSAAAEALPVDPKTTAELRKEVLGLPSYKNLSQAVPVYRAMADAAARDTKASDLNLIYGLGKIMDPNSVVREGEMVMANDTQGVADRLTGMIRSINGGARLSPDARQALMAEAYGRMNAYENAFSSDSNHYAGVAKRGRMAAEDVIPAFEAAKPWQVPQRSTGGPSGADTQMGVGNSATIGGNTVRRVR